MDLSFFSANPGLALLLLLAVAFGLLLLSK
jgi:hypothetical protein